MRKRAHHKRFALLSSALSCSLLLTACTSLGGDKPSVKVPVTDYRFDTAGNMFAYSEFELSGEPLAEGLGLDLDVMDVRKVDKPTRFDYTSAVKSYEYSEEAMYEVVEKSGLGLHLMHGSVNQELAKQAKTTSPEMLVNRLYRLADAVGYPRDQIFQNMYPTFMEYSGGDPHYIQKVDTGKFADGEGGTYVPNYQVDFATLRWDRHKMDKTLTPAAYGSTFLKQALWAGDFLGGFHEKESDKELEAKAAIDILNPKIGLGVSSADGIQGAILAEEIWNKLAYIQNHLFYNAKTARLEHGSGVHYDPAQGLQYLPHQIAVQEKVADGVAQSAGLTVTDPKSELQDQWLMLWPLSEYFAVLDQRPSNPNRNPAFQALFLNGLFPKAPKQNTDDSYQNDTFSLDPFSLNRNILLQVFRNIQAMHWNEQQGMFITEHNGTSQGDRMDVFQAGYTMEALRIFQRAYDGLPVGYASGEQGEGLHTPEGKQALDMIRKQADFLLAKGLDRQGLMGNGYSIRQGLDASPATLKAQIGAIRGLTSAYLALKDPKYREAARKLLVKVDQTFWDPEVTAYRTVGDRYVYDPYIAGGVSAMLRIGIQNLYNIPSDTEKPKELDRKTILNRFQGFYDQIIDGPSLHEGMQASEFWDTGDSYVTGDNSGNTDKDHVPQIQAGHGKYGISPILLPVELKKRQRGECTVEGGFSLLFHLCANDAENKYTTSRSIDPVCGNWIVCCESGAFL